MAGRRRYWRQWSLVRFRFGYIVHCGCILHFPLCLWVSISCLAPHDFLNDTLCVDLKVMEIEDSLCISFWCNGVTTSKFQGLLKPRFRVAKTCACTVSQTTFCGIFIRLTCREWITRDSTSRNSKGPLNLVSGQEWPRRRRPRPLPFGLCARTSRSKGSSIFLSWWCTRTCLKRNELEISMLRYESMWLN